MFLANMQLVDEVHGYSAWPVYASCCLNQIGRCSKVLHPSTPSPAQAHVLQSTNGIDHVVEGSRENIAASLRVFALLVLVVLSVLLGCFLAASTAGSDGCY